MRSKAPEDCPGVELRTNQGRSQERDLAALNGRRWARVSFEGAARKALPSRGTGKVPGGVDPVELLGAVLGLTREVKSAVQCSGGVPNVPVITTRRSEKIFYGEDP